LFKTGDFARRLDDGALMFEGRIDDQIKIRGERIDIGEIEAAIAKLVDEVGVIAMREGTYAFVVVALGGEGVKEDVLAACRDNISSVAIPRKVFLMDELPHTPSGKIDRKALRDHVHSWKSRQTYQSPTTELEKKVALIWMEVLETNEFGIDTEFLATGGDSMHAANIANRLSDLVALEIPSYLVIEAMTIRNIAAVIESVLEESDWSRQTERRVH
jgi:long-subunit acyl-CoA synthetase (AMP-forming)